MLDGRRMQAKVVEAVSLHDLEAWPLGTLGAWDRTVKQYSGYRHSSGACPPEPDVRVRYSGPSGICSCH